MPKLKLNPRTTFWGKCWFRARFYCGFKVTSLLDTANGGTVVQPDGGLTPEVKHRILDSTLEELRVKGIDSFSLTNVAERAQVELGTITNYWHNWRVLLMDAMLTRSREQIPTPQNGDVEKDLESYAQSLLEAATTVQGRRWFHRNLPNGQDSDLSDIRADFWSIRFSELVPILLQAAERGQIRNDIEPLQALQAFSAAVYYDVIFADREVSRDFVAMVIDIFLHGILTKDE